MLPQPDPPRNLPWFRLYTEFATDPAIQILAFEDQRHYVVLLCLKGAGVLDKSYPSAAIREAVLARSLGLSLHAADEALRRLNEAGLADLDGHPLAWERRQPVRDKSVERTRKWRQRKARDGGDGAVTVRDAADVDVDVDVEESKEKARQPTCGYVDNSVENTAAAPPALSQATEPRPPTPPRTNGNGPSLTYSEAIRAGLTATPRIPEKTLQAIVRAVRHVTGRRSGVPAAAVTEAVSQLAALLARGAAVDPWPYLLETIPLKADSLMEDRLEAGAPGFWRARA